MLWLASELDNLSYCLQFYAVELVDESEKEGVDGLISCVEA